MKWDKQDLNQAEVRGLSKRYSVDLLDASIFARRKINAPAQILYFLKNDLWYLHNPFLFASMEDAVDRDNAHGIERVHTDSYPGPIHTVYSYSLLRQLLNRDERVAGSYFGKSGRLWRGGAILDARGTDVRSVD